MNDPLSRRDVALGLAATAASAASPAFAANEDTYSEPEIVRAAERFFGAGAEGVATIVRRVFGEHGRPNGYIEGEEGSGAIGIGLRYGQGDMRLRAHAGSTRVYWQGPSLGFDTGGNASKVFTLIYNMQRPDQIFRRFPGVDGSAYFVGGVGVNYQRADNITLAPMRAGVGFRLGANLGYLAYSRRRRLNPF
ncbi:MAG: DUF1134 domain-containing protein [Hyphomonadaceae bacterium]